MRKLTAAIALAAALGGCQTTTESVTLAADAGEIQPELSQRLTSVAAAEQAGAVFTAYYISGADNVRRSRTAFNNGVLAFNTYTLLALGLGYHPHNAYISALGANALHGLDGVRNPGGEKAWLDAVGQVSCITSNLHSAAKYEALEYDDAALKAEYEMTLSDVQRGFLASYLTYRHATSQAPLKPADLPEAKARPSFTGGTTPTAAQKDPLLAEMRAARTAIRACTAAPQQS